MPKFLRQLLYKILIKTFPENDRILEHAGNWANGRNLFWGGAIAFKESFKQKSFSLNYSYEHDPIVEQIYSGLQQDFDSYSIVKYHLKKTNLKGLGGYDFLQKMVYLELKHRLPELLLMRLDKMTMASSIEGRVPFLDHKLVEFLLHLPMDMKFKNGVTKYLLKKACEGLLPDDVIYRKKVGFSAPVDKWFRNGNYFGKQKINNIGMRNTVVDDILKRHKGGTNLAPQIWVLNNLMHSLNN